MTNSSPLRRSQLLSSPDRSYLSNYLFDGRNTELSHRDALAAAQAEHHRVREAAIRVYELHELKEEHNRIVEQERREQERLKAEAAIAAEEKRLQELRAKSIPKPTPPPPPPPSEPQAAQPKPSPQPASPPKTVDTAKSEPPTLDTSEPKAAAPPPLSEAKTQPAASWPQTNGSLFSNISKPGQAAVNPFATSTTPKTTTSAPAPAATATPGPVAATPSQPKPPAQPASNRYSEIHQELKKLRKDIVADSKVAGSPLKGKLGTVRREIRVSIGQLTGGKGANAQPTTKIMNVLRQSLDGQLPSPPVDVSRFVAEPRQPAADSSTNNNEATLPSLFIYLMNICAKGIISQFINECGANPKAADPIGVFAAQVFSHKEFSWCGDSLIDILIAKFQVVCPVLFGARGNDRTERGRLALGWKRDGPANWIPEQNHNDRMAGLGAGFASISLRDFSKASKKNPYPPTHYWRAFSAIVNCPAGETSNTHFVVLRAIIEGHEQRFLNFYGNAAMAALRLALVEFPKKGAEHSSAAGSLRALAEILKSDGGLALA